MFHLLLSEYARIRNRLDFLNVGDHEQRNVAVLIPYSGR
jgi:hypothetical protein